MAIKQFTFTFKLDAQDLMEYIAQRNVAVEIQAFGAPHRKPKQLPPPSAPLALPPPVRNGGKPRCQTLVLAFMANHPKEKIQINILRELTIQGGLSPHTIHGQTWHMLQEGLIKKLGKGLYRITAKGLKRHQELTHG